MREVKKYKIIVAYDGTDFAGWQAQPHAHTVTGLLQDTFARVFGTTIAIAGASRTDAGVHALGQTAAFCTDLPIDVNRMLFAWHNKLPATILIRSIEEVALDWNPRRNVQQKTYYYHFFIERPLPFAARYGWLYPRPIDSEKLQQALNIFVGTHDFRSFCTGNDLENTIRTIDSATVEYVARYKVYRITIKGPGFLRYMIRRIVGACLDAASRDTLSCNDIETILINKNPQHHCMTAPAHGLMLARIRYKS